MKADRAEIRRQAKVVAIAGCVLGTAAAFAPSFLVMRPNRFVNGEVNSALTALGAWGWILVTLWVAAGLVALSPMPGTARGIATGLLGGGAAIVATWQSSVAAAAYTAAHGDIARVSFAYGYWLTLLAAYLVVFAATAWTPRGWPSVLVAYAPIAGIAALLFTGNLASLSVMREYANNASDFAAQFELQLLYVLAAVSAGVLIGLPLGLLAARRPAAEPVVFSVLNVLNVLPVLAFIGLLNPVLTSLSDSSPVVAALGVRGVGWAPVIVVLTAYAVYPITRNMYTAMTTLDPAVLDAAKGVGMGRWRRLFEVEFPLALPVVVAGIRIAVVQTTAGAIIAGLVGGGGLGTFVFLGASQTAADLILVGAVPIVAMALFFDRSALLLESLLGRWGVRA
ncbi:MAG: ABC transporter permease [Coriobacteriia bacterium]|nr:ABC transporter permease [Coriobacteriia bacterium]